MTTSTTFSSLTVTERQTKVNALLVPATKRMPLRIKRNNKVMGPVVKFVWDSLKADTKLSATKVVNEAKRLEATVA